VTGFSDAEEYAVAKEKLIPFMLEERLKELGANYTKVCLWAKASALAYLRLHVRIKCGSLNRGSAPHMLLLLAPRGSDTKPSDMRAAPHQQFVGALCLLLQRTREGDAQQHATHARVAR
jgi:hypothetical protein